jgi:LDH2 family malate/lactate/ureidoglycolate dehydrogenase
MSERRAASEPAAAIATADALHRFARDVFTRVGMSAEHAATVAGALVWANLRGVDSHGVTRIPRYVELVERGDVNPAPVLTVRIDTAASVLIDADHAPGPVAMTAAMGAAVRKAREAGIGVALVRATTHTGAIGYYTQQGARHGMAALGVSASVPFMAYHGARVPSLATNPLSIAIPRGEREPLLLDMASSVVAMGRLLQAKRAGQPIPAGWALDAQGAPTTDPRAAEIPLPLGGPKGSGLSLMIECLTSLVIGNPIIAEALEGTAVGRQHRQNALTLAIDVARFGDPATFHREVSRLAAVLKALPRDPGVTEILMPGERGSRTAERRRRDGIPVPLAVRDELLALSDRLGIAMFPATTRP